jgi:glycosyltransferase involved in cell wall biosynthesis
VLGELAERVDLSAVFCARTGSRGAEWTFSTPFPFRHRILGGPAIRRRSGEASDLYPDPRLLTTLIRDRPDAVISAAFSFPTVAAAVYGRATGARLIIHSDGTSHSERNLSAVQRLARRVLMREASAYVGNSRAAVERFLEMGARADRVVAAPHSTRIEPFHAVARDRVPRPATREVVVAHVGRLIARKGVDRLLRAVAASRPAVPLRLRLVGTGPEEPRLRRLAGELGAESVVEFSGFVDQSAMPRVYADADVLAFPTLDDTFGMVVVEAAAAGLPIVASPFAGATLELVEDGVNGFVADPDDTDAWTHALVTLSRDASLRQRFGRRSHELTLDRTAARTADGYAESVRVALEHPGHDIRRPRFKRGPD